MAKTRGKWKELGPKLFDYILNHVDEHGNIHTPINEIIQKFADENNTTKNSATQYYYSSIRDELEDAINHSIKIVTKNDEDNEKGLPRNVRKFINLRQKEVATENNLSSLGDQGENTPTWINFDTGNEEYIEEEPEEEHIEEVQNEDDPKVEREVENIALYISENTSYKVSNKSKMVIKNAVKEYGRIDAMIKVLDVINKNGDEPDILYLMLKGEKHLD